MNKTNLLSNQIGIDGNFESCLNLGNIKCLSLYRNKKAKCGCVGNALKDEALTLWLTGKYCQHCVLPLGKQQFSHTWNLFKTITGAVGLKAIRLDLHLWTQGI